MNPSSMILPAGTRIENVRIEEVSRWGGIAGLCGDDDPSSPVR